MNIIDEREDKGYKVNVGDVIVDTSNEMYLIICGIGIVAEKYDFTFALVRLSDLALYEATDGSVDDLINYVVKNFIDIKEIVPQDKLSLKIS